MHTCDIFGICYKVHARVNNDQIVNRVPKVSCKQHSNSVTPCILEECGKAKVYGKKLVS